MGRRIAGRQSGIHAHKTARYVQRGVAKPATPGCPFLLLETAVVVALLVRAVKR
jgi:hypothetical protein